MASETSNFDYLALKNEGNALYSAGDFLGAVQKYSKALIFCTDNNTDRTILLKNRAAAYLNLQEYQKVIEDTSAALEITPSDIKALYRRCQAYEQLGKYNEAFEDARAVNRLNPQNSAIQPYLRRLQEIKPVIIEESSETVLSETSNLDYLALKDEGNALYSAGDFPAAVQKYSKCLKLCMDKNTDRSTLLKNRAAAYLNLREYQKVVEDTTAALEITPSDIKALYRRCQACEQLGKYNEAFEDARAVNRLDPQNSAIQPYLMRLKEIVNESNEDALDINSLPNEMIVEIFGYLKQNQLGQIARVCRRWNELTKDPLLWKKVNVKIFSSDRDENAVAKSFINGLPSCVTSIRLDFGEDFLGEDFTLVHFEKLCVKLHQNCPHLEELILARCHISNILPLVINFCTQFLQCVKKLVFHNCDFFYDYSRTVELIANSKIEALDLCNCDLSDLCKTQFSKLLYLKELRLAITNVDDTWFVNDTSFLNQLRVLDLRRTRITTNTFRAIQTHGQNLKELYLCYANLGIRDFDFSKSAFPQLKTICISGTFAICEDVVSLIQSCPSLENVYVSERVVEPFAAHPFVVANRCKSGIVQAIDYDHNHNVDYSLN